MHIRRLAVPFALLASTLVSTPAAADGAWIDQQPIANWNQPGVAVPAAPTPSSTNAMDPRCLDSTRPPETIEDAQVTHQGWRLIGQYYGGWGARVVLGASDFDGMCRPNGYQAFVFQYGIFAGTLSPDLMNSRTDGALSTVMVIRGGQPSGPPQIRGTFLRYTPQDALCCASATSSVTYEVTIEGGKPLVTPTQAMTTQNPTT